MRFIFDLFINSNTILPSDYFCIQKMASSDAGMPRLMPVDRGYAWAVCGGKRGCVSRGDGEELNMEI